MKADHKMKPGDSSTEIETLETRHTLQFSIRIIACVCLTLFGLCAVFAIRIQANLNYSELAGLEKDLADSYFSRMENDLAGAESMSMKILGDSSVQEELAFIANTRDNNSALAKAMLRIKALLPMLNSGTDSLIKYLVLVDSKDNYYISSNVSNIDRLRHQFAQLIEASDTSGSVCWHAVEFDGNECIVLVRAIREIANTSLRHLGYEIICLDVQQLLKKAGMNDSQYILSTAAYLNGECFYLGNECPISAEEKLRPKEKRGWVMRRLNGSSWLITSASFMKGQITAVHYANSDKIMRTSRINQRLMIVVMFVLMVLFLIIIIMVIDKRFKRLSRLTTIVRNASENGYSVVLEDDLKNSRDEIGVFARCFQEQMNEIDQLVNKNLKQELLSSQAQVQALRAQIHPHFLCNTLDTIHSIAEEEHSARISRITESLSKLVRASFRGKAFNSLAQEIEFVQEYLLIYRVRFGERLRAQIEWQHEDEQLSLPRMILQPLVENAIRYSLMTKTTTGVIRLKIRRAGNRLVISLYDNGKGFSRELMEYYRSLQFPDSSETHGLTNILYRLRTVYGERFTFQIHSREGKWTNISLIIPAAEAKEEELG